jgi:putative ABC transport system permease protein
MNILEGRNFSTEMPTDSQAIIINQAMKEKFGFDKAVGKQIVNFAAPWEIIGVVDNFHFESLKMNIEPLAMVLSNSNKTISVKVNTTDMPRLTTALTATWDKFSPNQPIRYSFLDESFANMYTDVQRTGRIFTSFAILAIIIACLGLFALSAFMAEQRSKEIGIRKVLGASMETILQLLTRNFLRLVLISLVVAIPIGWYLMRKWLEDFVYRIDIRWEVFLIAGGLAVMIALLTVSFQAIRTATRNPVDSLRSE